MQTETGKTPALAPWGRWDRIAMWLILGGSSVYALIVLVSGVGRLVHQSVSQTWTGSLIVERALPAEADAGTATLITGSYESASVTLGDLSGWAFGLLTAALVIAVITSATVALSFVYLSWRLLRAEPFKKSLTFTFITAGTALIIGSILSLGVEALGRVIAISELLGDDKVTGFWPMAFNGDLSPIGFGLALLIVACAFEYGERLTRQTDGLV
jgi:hypothetical protein